MTIGAPSVGEGTPDENAPGRHRAADIARRFALLAVRRLWFIALIVGVWVLVTATGWVPSFRLPGNWFSTWFLPEIQVR